LIVVMIVALKVVVEMYLTNKHIDSLTLLVTSGILTEWRFNMKELSTIDGRYVGNVSCSTVRDHSVCPLARQC
jgi:hypothetical protein